MRSNSLCRAGVLIHNPLMQSIIALFLLATIFCGSAYGVGGDILGQYSHVLNGKQEAMAVAVDNDGTMIITGYTLDSYEDFFTIKIAADGNSMLWASPKTFDLSGGSDIAIGVVIDSQSNVIVTGSAFNGSDFDFHTIKYDGDDGSVIWQNTYNGPNGGHNYPKSIALDNLDNIYIGGYTPGTSGPDDFLVIKYNASGPIGGRPTWAKTYNNVSADNHDRVNAIAVSSGNPAYIAVTGISNNDVNFDVLTVKYDEDGTQIWAEIYPGSSNDDAGKDVKIDSSDDVIVTAEVYNGTFDIYTVKYTGNAASAVVDWQITYNGGNVDSPTSLILDSADNVYVTGTTWTSAGKTDIFTAKYYGTGVSKGSPAWPAKIYDSGDDNSDTPTGIALDSSSVYVTGYTHNSTRGDDDFRTIKYQRDNGNQSWTVAFDGGLNKNDKALGIGLSSSGDLYVAGWIDNTPATDYDFKAIKYNPGALNTPTNLVLTLVTENLVRLDWTVNSTGEEGFHVFRKIGAFDPWPDTPTLTVVGAGTATYNDTGVSPHIKYYYKVRAYNDTNGNYSHFSNEASILTTDISYIAPTWTYKYAGPDGSDDEARGIAVGPDFNPVVTGYSFSSAGSFDYYTVKLNYTNAAVIWAERYTDPDGEIDEGQCLVVDSNNDVIVTGYSSLSFGGAENTLDLFTLKYYANFNSLGKGIDYNGDPIWSDQYDGPENGDDRASAIDSATDSSDNIAVVGYGRNSANNDDIYLIKYLKDAIPDTTSASRAWEPMVFDGGGMDQPAALVFDYNNDIIVTGQTSAVTDTNYDIFTRKYSGVDGTTIWTVIHDSGQGHDGGNDVAVDSENNVYVTGYVSTAGNGKDLYIVKYCGNSDPVTCDGHAQGEVVWTRTFNGTGNGDDIGEAVRVDLNGDEDNIVVAGTILEGVDNNDFYLVRYTASNIEVWTRILDRASDNDLVRAMDMDASGSVCVAGDTDSSGSSDMLAVKYDYDGDIVGSTLYNNTGVNLADGTAAVAVSRTGDAFVAGYSTNASNNFDYMVMKCEGDVLQSPAPFTNAFYYKHIDFSWVNNTLDGNGFRMRRQIGDCASAIEANWTWFDPFPIGQTTYQDLNLNIGTTYCYQIQAYKDNGEESRWLEKTITTVHPPAPTDFVATAFESTRVHLTWTDNINGEDSFVIQRCDQGLYDCTTPAPHVDDLTDPGYNRYTTVATLSAGIVTYDDFSACEGKTYTYRLQAHLETEWDTYFAYVENVAMAAKAAPVLEPLVVQSEGRIDLNWSDTNVNETGFKVYRCEGTGCTPTIPDHLIATVKSPLVSYKMDEAWVAGNPGDVIDSSGNDRHATAYGNASAGIFDGNNDYVHIGLINPLSATGYLTVEIWFNRQVDISGANPIATNHNVNNVLFAQSSTPYWDHLEIGTEGSNIEIFLRDSLNYSNTVTVNAGITNNTLYHLVMTYNKDDANELKVYLNGSLVSGGQWSEFGGNLTLFADQAPYSIGVARSDGTQLWGDFNGTIDELAVYNSALSATEILAAYNNGGNVPLSYTDMPLAPSTTYNYLVTAYKTAPDSCDGGWVSAVSTVREDITDDVAGAAHVPVLLTAVKDPTEVTSKINITWQDKSETEEGFIIERCDNDKATCDGGAFSTPAASFTVGANVTTYSDTTACQNTYTYRVRAKRDNAPIWTSNPSNTIAATTDSISDPVSLTWDNANSNEEDVKLTWTANTTDETTFEIDRCLGAACDFSTKVTQAVGRGVPTFTDTRRTPDTTYRYQVRATNSTCGWNTSYTNIVTANTNISNKGTLNPQAKVINTTRIDLSWTDITSHETGFIVDRCEGGACDFSTKVTYVVDDGITSYSDTTDVCQDGIYSYRVRAIDQDFENGFNDCWTKRIPVTDLNPFAANSLIELTINKATYPEMQNDFDDMRFYQFTDGTKTDGAPLQYWIARKIDGSTAKVWIKTGANPDNIFMYYGNPSATDAGDNSGWFNFSDNFQGTTINTSKWAEIDPDNSISQNNNLLLIDVSDAWNKAFISKQTFTRTAGKIFYVKLKIGADTVGNNHFMSGWEIDQTTDPNQTQLIHGFYWNNTGILTYEKGANTGASSSGYAWDTEYEMKVVLKDIGADYYIRGGVYANWTLVKSTVTYADSPMRVAFVQYSHEAFIHFAGVRDSDIPASTLSFGTAENAVCGTLPHVWQSTYSSVISPQAKAMATPSLDPGIPRSESEIEIAFTDTNWDETNITLEWCAGDQAVCDTDIEFAPLTSFSNTPRLLMHFDETAGSWNGTANEVVNSVSNSFHGTAVNAANTVAGGKYNNAAIVNGSNYIQVGDPAGLRLSDGNAFTIEAWFKPSVNVTAMSTANPLFIFKRNWLVGGYGGHFTKSDGKVNAQYCWPGGALTAVSTTVFTAGNWYHYTATFDGSSLKLYINGVLEANAAATQPMGSSAGFNLTIGNGFKGNIDDAAIYDRALSLAEIQNHFAQGVTMRYRHQGLTQNTEYTYQIKADKTASCGWTTPYSTRMTASTFLPPAPAITSVVVDNTTQTTIYWDDNTGSNTVFDIQRSEFSGTWSPFASIGTAEGEALSFVDSTVCKNSQYKYQVLAVNEAFPTSLSNPGGTGWSRRSPLAITNFIADFQTKVVIPYDPDMQADFADIRFYDETAAAELPYWIESKTDGVTATVWFKTGANNNINLYYGNFIAASSSNGNATFLLFDDFNDNSINASKWTTAGSHANSLPIAETGGVLLRGTDAVSNNVWSYFQSVSAFDKYRIEEFNMRVVTYTGGVPKWQDNQAYVIFNNAAAGWKWNKWNPAASWVDMAYSPTISTGSGFSKVKFVMESTGVSIYENDSFVAKNSFANSAGTSVVGVNVNQQTAVEDWRFDLDDYRVRKYAATEPSVSIGAEDDSATFDWTSDPSTESSSVTTPNITLPVLNTVTRASESRINLAWTWGDATSDETGFEVDRCAGLGCDFSSKTTMTLPANTLSFTDSGLADGTAYCYRVRAVKSAPGSCQDGWGANDGWASAYSVLSSPDSCATTTITAPDPVDVTTAPSNTTQTEIAWTDNTGSEEGFIIWRCPELNTGTCADPAVDGNYVDFTGTIGTAGANQISLSDPTVCNNKTYFYKVQAISEGSAGPNIPVLSNPGGGAWTKRRNLSITNPQANYQTKVTITYDSDMQADFDDIRIYDEFAEAELPYWIQSKTNSSTATVWFKTQANGDSISLYYGNPNATSSSNGSTVFIEFSSRSRSGAFAQTYQNSNGFIINAGTFGFSYYSTQNAMIEFDKNGNARTKIRHASNNYYRNDYNSAGSSIIQNNTAASYTYNELHQWEVRVKDSTYWFKVDGTQKLNYSNLTYSSGTIAWGGWDASYQRGYFDFIFTRKYAATDPTVVVGSEQDTPVGSWTSVKSGYDFATTAAPTAPVMDTVNTKKLSEGKVQVVWTDVNPDESHFTIWRGDAACSNWSEINNTGAPNILNYSDTGTDIDPVYGLNYNTTYCYKVQAHKTGIDCPWNGPDSNTFTVTTTVPVPAGVVATVVDSTTIQVAWDDTTTTEDKFEIWRCQGTQATCVSIAGNDFGATPIGTVSGYTVTTSKLFYTDTGVCPDTVYTYIIRAIRNSNWSVDSLRATSSATIATSMPSGLSLSEVYDPLLDQRQIDLTWSDTNNDETGFEVERCNYTISGDCSALSGNFARIYTLYSNDDFKTEVDPLFWKLAGSVQPDPTVANQLAPLSLSNANGSADIYWENETAVMVTSATNFGPSTDWNSAQMAMINPEILGSGDFDLQVDWSLPDLVIPDTVTKIHIYLRLVIAFDDGDWLLMDRDVNNGNGYYWGVFSINGIDPSPDYYLPTTDTAGKFRVTRSGTTITGYNWAEGDNPGTGGVVENGYWYQVVTAQDIAGSVPIQVSLDKQTRQDEVVTSKTVIDNFKINPTAATLRHSDLDSLDPSVDYYYRVRAYKGHSATCGDWDGLYTNITNEATNPAKPTAFLASPEGSMKIKLTWTDNAVDETSYKIEKKMWNNVWVEIDSIAQNSELYRDTLGLNPDSSYTYRIRAYRSGDNSYSPYSDEATTTTNIYGGQWVDDTTCLPIE